MASSKTPKTISFMDPEEENCTSSHEKRCFRNKSFSMIDLSSEDDSFSQRVRARSIGVRTAKCCGVIEEDPTIGEDIMATPNDIIPSYSTGVVILSFILLWKHSQELEEHFQRAQRALR